MTAMAMSVGQVGAKGEEGREEVLEWKGFLVTISGLIVG